MLKFDSININGRKIKVGIFLILLLTCATFTLRHLQSDMNVQTPLTTSHKHIEAGNYFDALLALKPLLKSEQKSDAQEEAFWIAHVVTLNWEKAIIENSLWGRETNKQINTINEFGADFDNIEINFGYRYGFLQQLINLYPDSERRPIAEYYLIQKNYPAPICISGEDDILDKLQTYVDKYEKTGRFEVYMAYLDMAHIHHGLWAVLTYPDELGPGGERIGSGYTSADPEKDKKRAAEHKAEALKYYGLYHLNPHKLPVVESYDRLKKNEAFGWNFILWGC